MCACSADTLVRDMTYDIHIHMCVCVYVCVYSADALVQEMTRPLQDDI